MHTRSRSVEIDRTILSDWLSHRLGRPVSKGALEKLAERGEGPPYRIILGQAAYDPEDLKAWLASTAGEPQRQPRRGTVSRSQIAA